MAEQIHYTRAPIQQAVIDIRLRDYRIPMEELDALGARISEKYPVRQSLNHATVEIKLGDQAETNKPESLHVGFAFLSSDSKNVFQVQASGATFSRMAPYDTWDSFIVEFRYLLGSYLGAHHVETFDRVAVRYINRLDLPLPFSDFKEYILTIPEVAPKLPQMLSGFVMQIHLPQTDIDAMLILNEGMVPPAREGVASIMLDFDLMKMSVSNATLWSVLDMLHARKNDVFEACITDRTRELIK